MHNERIRVLVPPPIEVRRGAEWVASAVVWMLQAALCCAHLLRRLTVAPRKGDPDDRVPLQGGRGVV